VHHQAMSLTAIAVPDLLGPIETVVRPDPLGTTTVPRGKNVLLLLIVKQNAWPN
jgi:hypothetical protein